MSKPPGMPETPDGTPTTQSMVRALGAPARCTGSGRAARKHLGRCLVPNTLTGNKMQHLSPPLWCGTAFCELPFVAQNVRVSRIHVPPHFPGPAILQPPCSEAGPEFWPVRMDRGVCMPLPGLAPKTSHQTFMLALSTHFLPQYRGSHGELRSPGSGGTIGQSEPRFPDLSPHCFDTV